jgi:hypothetical protein
VHEHKIDERKPIHGKRDDSRTASTAFRQGRRRDDKKLLGVLFAIAATRLPYYGE